MDNRDHRFERLTAEQIAERDEIKRRYDDANRAITHARFNGTKQPRPSVPFRQS